jgi:tRNA pseudouridine38-40 synthase
MPRYFIEVSYKGTAYSGFQKQQNANSVQAEIEKALKILFRHDFELTGSSRTDAGVHALQNFFHFDSEQRVNDAVYQLNAILPWDIVVKAITERAADAHCRFDAIAREYCYYIYSKKDPFISDRAYYYPYEMDTYKLNAAAAIVMRHKDFTSFSKRNTQVKSFICSITESNWKQEGERLVYRVRANRFLRGMVKGLVGTMLQVGRGKLGLEQFEEIILSGDSSRADFSVPSHGLFLVRVLF